jgi:sugar lactone lactonase YvrE
MKPNALRCWLLLIGTVLSGCGREEPPLPGNAGDAFRNYLYWTDLTGSRILRTPANGTGKVDTLYGPVDEIGSPHGLVIDGLSGRMYWADYTNGRIMAGNLDGSGRPEILFNRQDGVSRPVALALDALHHRLYWTEPDHDRIMWVSLPGGSPRELYGRRNGVDRPFGIALDPARGYAYWVEAGDGQVVRGSLNGGTPPFILYHGTHGLQAPFGLTLDAAANRLYVLDNPVLVSGSKEGTDRLWRGRSDGTGTLEVLYDEADGVRNAYSVLVDPRRQRIFWLNQLESSVIMQGDLEGSTPAGTFSEVSGIGFAVALYDPAERL